MIEELTDAIAQEINVDTYPDLIQGPGLEGRVSVDLEGGRLIVLAADGQMYRITVEHIVVDDQGRVGVVEGDRCDFCVEHGVAKCEHQGM